MCMRWYFLGNGWADEGGGLDQQLGQLYELMQAIQKKEREGDDEGVL